IYLKLGQSLTRQGRVLEARAAFERLTRLREEQEAGGAPSWDDSPELVFHQAIALAELGRMPEVEQLYRRALPRFPAADDQVALLNNLANCLKDQHRLVEAEQCLRQAMAIDPRSLVVRHNLEVLLGQEGKLLESLALYEESLVRQPESVRTFSNYLFTLNYHPDKSAEQIYQAYAEFDRRFCAPLRQQWRPHDNARTLDRRLRVGYLSPDFRQHSCSWFMEPLLAGHDRSRVEIFAYANIEHEDEVTRRYKTYVEHWVPTHGMSDEALAQRIREDRIDILVDPAGHTANHRLAVFARKPAPVSVTWMGFGYTTGLKAIDYFLTDGFTAPEGSEGLFAEQPWRLRRSAYAAYRPPPYAGQVSELPALQRGYVTFGTLSRGIRLNHHVIRVWSELLRRLPTAVLVIDSITYIDPALREELLERFVAQGADVSRVQVGHHHPPWDVLRGLDIALDCFPQNSGTTLFESLYMGLPFVSLVGRPSLGRMGGAILSGLGRPEWMAATEEDYLEKLVALASDLPALARLRAGLRAEMQSSVLMDEAGFAAEVEQAYRAMFTRWAEGGSPTGPGDELARLRQAFEQGQGAQVVPEALALVRREPANGPAWRLLGVLLQDAGHTDAAIEAKRMAVGLLPRDPDAHFNLALSLEKQEDWAAAREAYLRTLALRPRDAEALFNLGNVLVKQDQRLPALGCFEQALTVQPGHLGAHLNAAGLLETLARHDEALAHSRQVIAARPDWAQAFDSYLFTVNYHPTLSAEQVYAAFAAYEARFGQPLRALWQAPANTRVAGRRLRVGYVSPDFRQHSCVYFLEPLLSHHDHEGFEVWAYADLALGEDPVTQRYKALVDQWVPTKGMSDEALAQRIRDDGIDILVDLAGHTVGNRLGVFARKPAPVSVSWMGYGYTTGLKAIDYFLTDEFNAPEGSEGLFSERPWRLQGPYTSYRPAATAWEVGELPADRKGHITFGTLTRGVRLNERLLQVWAQVLKRVPGSVLKVDSASFQDEGIQGELRKRFEALGIEGGRIEAGYNAPAWKALSEVDIGLDCFPHNSGTTLFETLYAGVPYVSLAGRPSAGRMGGAILKGLGRSEWIAYSEAEYVDKLVGLAEDVPGLRALRAGLRAEMRASALMDEPRFTRRVEAAYRAMFQSWMEGKTA
ncbi:MAG: tetratricopeptide repeat protein, partial [Curvibacter sp.]|nr:tetratricopeptide repeat protein [Curvibacter sp.]